MSDIVAHLDRAWVAGRRWCLESGCGATPTPEAVDAARAYARQYEVSPERRASPGMRDTLAEAFLLGVTVMTTLSLAPPAHRPAAEA